MGTNYYLTKKCTSCNHEEKIHIGKSSAGWCFGLHVYPKEENKTIGELPIIIESLHDWSNWFKKPDWKILNEYGEEFHCLDMIKIITEKTWKKNTEIPYHYISWEDFYNKNNAVPGPNNLLRSRIDNSHCIGHGDGTWDLLVGEFS